MSEPVVCEAFAKLSRLGIAVGAAPLTKHTGCWEYRIDERWTIAVNGHDRDMKSSSGISVPPYHCAIEYLGWPAGVITVHGGVIAAGSEANEDAFIEAIDRRLSALEVMQ